MFAYAERFSDLNVKPADVSLKPIAVNTDGICKRIEGGCAFVFALHVSMKYIPRRRKRHNNSE